MPGAGGRRSRRGPAGRLLLTVVTGDAHGALLHEETHPAGDHADGRSKQEGERLLGASGLPAVEDLPVPPSTGRCGAEELLARLRERAASQ